jgi:hypothetical protein
MERVNWTAAKSGKEIEDQTMKTNKNGNWQAYWGVMPLPQGAEALGTVTRDTGETGALIRMPTGICSQGNAGVLRSLP